MEFLKKLKSNYYRNYEEKFPKSELRKTDRNEYNRLRMEYDNASYDSEQEFKKDLLKHFEVTKNPKANECYKLAWEHGHSSGFEEVYNYFCDFVDLIK